MMVDEKRIGGLSKGVRYFLWTLIGVVLLSLLALATTTITETSIDTGTLNVINLIMNGDIDMKNIGDIKNASIIEVQNILLGGNNKQGRLYLFGGDVTDSAGQTNRSLISFFAANDREFSFLDRGLSIEVHSNNGSDVNHISFYSTLRNDSSVSPRAFEWQWGHDTDGRLSLFQLNKLTFPESYVGYYGNESEDFSAIESKAETLKFIADQGGAEGIGEFLFLYGSGETQIANFTESEINFNQDVIIIGNLEFDGDSFIRHGSSNILKVYSSGLAAQDNKNIMFGSSVDYSIGYNDSSDKLEFRDGFLVGQNVRFSLDSDGVLQLVSNVTAMICNGDNAGGLYFDGTTKRHYGCNSTEWNALY